MRWGSWISGVVVMATLAALLGTASDTSRAATSYSILVSSSATRAPASALAGATVAGNIAVFTSPTTDATQVRFWLDNPAATGTPRLTENFPPFDFATTAANGNATLFNTTQIPDGSHSITALVTTSTGVQTITATFTVANQTPPPPALKATPATLSFTGQQGAASPATQTVAITTTNNTTPTITTTSNAAWLTTQPSSGAAPLTHTVKADTTGLAAGTYTGTLTSTATGLTSATTTVTLTVTPAPPPPALKATPATLSFTGQQGAASPATQTVAITTTNNTTPTITTTSNAAWLTTQPSSGAAPLTHTVKADTTGLAAGTYTGTLTSTATGLTSATTTVTLTVTPTGGGGSPYSLVVSSSATRTSPSALAGKTVAGNIAVFTTPTTGVTQVRFWLDNPAATGTPRQTENAAAFDFAGTAANGNATLFNTTQIPDGSHSITALVTTSTGVQTIAATFTVANQTPPPPALKATPATLSFTGQQGAASPATQTVAITTTNNTTPTITTTSNAAWLTTQPSSGAAPLTHTVKADTTGLAAGTYTGTLTSTATGLTSATTTVTLTVTPAGGGGGTTCSPVPCAQVKIGLPYTLEFASGAGGVLDKNGVGTGFTWIDKPATGTGYVPANLAVDTASGVLHYTTANGIAYTQANSLVNGLGVGIAAPNQTTVLSTTIVNPPAGTGAFQQAGVWFGIDQDNYDKLVIMSTPSGTVVQHQLEALGATVQSLDSTPQALTGTSITLTLTADPIAETIAASFAVGAGAAQALGVYPAPPEFFSFDAAGIDPILGTRSFGGIFATHRNGPAPIVYDFGRFSVTAGASGGGGGGGTPPGISFTRSTFSVPTPTAMAWGPDGRLYVTELFGTIHAISFDASGGVAGNQVITTLGSRLALGITVDPASTAANVVLWVSHSNPSTNAGVANSGTVSRLSGTGFTTRTDVITGLPRAIANHATNGLDFGPDGRLYIAQAGNTGAGAANNANTEFGTRAEQPLSAAILVAAVKASGFNGACANSADIYGPVTCDVQTYATGFRNPYDLAWHSNGQLYAPDNGLGVTGSYPPSPTAPCTGFGDPALYTSGGDNPGEQPDLLFRVVAGKYYGHPNPTRGECVFKNGSFQNVAPLANYMAPLTVLGLHKSADGIIEYRGSAFCGTLAGSLLIANYSTGNDITRVKLSADGTSVVSTETLVGSLTDPLALEQAPDGRIFVGELDASRITVLKPVATSC